MRFGEPTSSRVSGVTVAAFRPSPCVADRRRSLVHDAVRRRAAAFEREVEARQFELEADHVGGEDAERLFEQFLPGLVAFEDHDRFWFHGGQD